MMPFILMLQCQGFVELMGFVMTLQLHQLFLGRTSVVNAFKKTKNLQSVANTSQFK